MPTLTHILLILHITCGAIGLLSGTFNIIRRKGDHLHRRIGLIFAWTMIINGISAISLSLINPNYFLTIIGIFTLYMVGTGYRYIYLRMHLVNNDPKALDWLLTSGMAVAGLAFIVLGILKLVQLDFFGCVYLVFGGIGGLFVRRDLQNYRGLSLDRNYWLLAHLQRMTGGYIAALTAFLVVNGHFFPSFIPSMVIWLLPTMVITPFIIRWSSQYVIRK